MDDRRFDQLARTLGGASTRRGALATLAGIAVGLGAAGKDADAKKKRKKCDPLCAAGQTCRQGACACDNGGTVCGASCCTAGQTCQSGVCADPLPQCLAVGAACKDTGVPCCDGTVCASGQGGQGDIACYKPAGVACEATVDCVFDSSCKNGVCVANPQPQPQPACVPAFPVTGDAEVNGLALRDAWEAAKTGGPTVIGLAPGTYAVPHGATANDPGLAWSAGDVILQACPGAPVTLTYAETALFGIDGGSVTLKGLTLTGSTSQALYGVGASEQSLPVSLTLDRCRVTGFGQAGVSANGAGVTVTVIGGTYTPNGTIGDPSTDVSYSNNAGASTFTCSGSPTAARCQGFANVGLAIPCGCTST